MDKFFHKFKSDLNNARLNFEAFEFKPIKSETDEAGEPEPKQYRSFFRKPKITAILTNQTNFNVKFRTQINYINLLGSSRNETNNVEATINLKNKEMKEIHVSLNNENKLIQESKKTSFIKNPPINLEKKIMPSTQALCGLKNKSNTNGELIEDKREELRVLLQKYTNIMKKQKKTVRRKDKIDQLNAVDKNESILDQYANKNYAKLNPFKIKLNSKPKARLKMSKSLKYTLIENEYLKTISKDENEVTFKFLIFNKSNKLLVFCSPIGFSILSKSKYWQASGKFHISSKHYFQLHVIYAWFMGRMFPCVYSLMHRMREKDYNLLFRYTRYRDKKYLLLFLKTG